VIKPFVIVGLAATTLIGGVVFFVTPSTEVAASTSVAKGDRLDIQRSKAECSQHAWPYYLSNCLRDFRRATRKASEVRFVFAGQIPNASK
jgi:hypothetical protein